MNTEALKTDVPYDLAFAAHQGTSFVPEKRAEQRQNDYAASLAADYEQFRQAAEKGGTLDQLDEQFARYRAGYKKRYCAWLSANSRCMSWMITGPANFPTARNEKRNRSADNRLQELIDFRERAKRAIMRILRPDLRPIMSGDSDAVQRLKVELEKGEKLQQAMKDANAAIRRFKKDGAAAQVAALVELGFDATRAQKLLLPDFCGRIGFPDYALQNNGANLRRIKERIEKIARNQAIPAATVEGVGVTVEDDPPANRVRLIFPGKPSEEIRADLKRSGFRWSPTIGAWQAYRNHRTIETAKRIAGV